MLLVVNAGSSSIKLAVFDAGLGQALAGSVTEIGGVGRLKIGKIDQDCTAADHRAALELAFAGMAAAGVPISALTAAAHRVVHGGADLTAACRVTPATMAAIEACVPLAPLHNPANLTAMRALAVLAPDLPQYASFDTGFHASNPDVAITYALPATERARGIRRYGFHGLSYAGMVETLRAQGCLPKRLLALHLGNGASLCAIVNGKSVATTMGYSPLDGLTMGTRAGSIDGNAVLRLAEVHGISRAAAILNRESGLLGLGGHSDMRQLQAADTAEARFAIAHFRYWLVRHAGSMIAAMRGVDGIAFTGGIGENDADLRAAVMDELAWAGVERDPAPTGMQLHSAASRVGAWIVPANEERRIAAEAQALIGQGR